jgi:hypothetical protein
MDYPQHRQFSGGSIRKVILASFSRYCSLTFSVKRSRWSRLPALGWTTVEEAHGSGKKISVEGERAWSTPAPNHPELGDGDVLGVAI